jgi:hypothetical protein
LLKLKRIILKKHAVADAKGIASIRHASVGMLGMERTSRFGQADYVANVGKSLSSKEENKENALASIAKLSFTVGMTRCFVHKNAKLGFRQKKKSTELFSARHAENTMKVLNGNVIDQSSFVIWIAKENMR